MRVCLVTGSFPRMDCGVGDYSWQLARHLAAEASVTVLTGDRSTIRAFLSEPEARDAAESGRLLVRPVAATWSLRALAELRRLVMESRPDVVHIQYAATAFDLKAGPTLLPRTLRRVTDRPVVVTTVHDPAGPRLFPRAGGLRDLLVRLLCQDSDLVCCPDRLVCDRIGAWLAGSPRQLPAGVNVVPAPGYLEEGADGPSVSPAWLAAARERLRRDHPAAFDGGPILLSFGNVHPDRDYESVVEALRRLAKREDRRGPNWQRARWILVGGAGRGGDTRRAQGLRGLLDRTGLAEQVYFAGYCPPDRVTAWMAAADLCLLLLPHGVTDARTSLLTALAHGKPTVAVGRGVYSDELRDGEHFCWSPAGDPDRLAVVLDELMRDAERRARLGRAGLDLVRRRYAWPRIATETLRLYEAVTRNT